MARKKTIADMPDKFEAGYLNRLDGRTAIANDMRGRWQEITEDLGGAASLSYAQRSLVERALWLEHWLQVQERALAEGRVEDFDSGRWTQGCNSLVGILSRLGLERSPRDVSLANYLEGKSQ
ncbi:hypothetical protein [Tropicimonas sediminicola]|uniref:Uncharacterized protein n=1 Tax=Tropicimonas sediminicola TaxID=1031541 RepID=A0A239M5Z0_9RHOB|nr:hypothetical protein [Tropicimonas sediminicola]SNT38116.1 hypothetical protein SAMN05421757_11368 [Tropicimonas sediminicola]